MSALTMTMRDRDRPLGKLLLAANDAGHTWRDLAMRAAQMGHRISAAQLNSLALGHVRKMPREDDIAAIAAAIGRPADEVLRAALAEFYGGMYRTHADPGSSRLVAVPADATEAQVAQIRRIIDAWWAARDTQED